MPTILFENGPDRGSGVELEADRTYTVGRDPRRDIIVQSELASRQHCQIKGFREADAELLIAARKTPYKNVRDLWLRSGLSRAGLERLAEADAFRSVGLDRRQALWEVRALDFAAGDLLVIYTDGVVEARDSDRQRYGVERLIELVREQRHLEAADIRDRVLIDLVRHREGAPTHDDVTLVVVRAVGKDR